MATASTAVATSVASALSSVVSSASSAASSAATVVCGTAASDTHPAAALTTIFTPPSSCNWPPTTYPAPDGCLPDNFGDYWKCTTREDYFSPAICPSGYTPVASVWDTLAGPPVTSGESAWQCCPTAYTTVPTSGTSGWRSYCYNSAGAYAYGMQIRWKSSDLSILATLPLKPGQKFNGVSTVSAGATTGGSSATGTSSGTKTHSASSTSTQSSSGSGSLSSGAKAGIGIGVALAAILFAIGAFFLIRRHKRQQSKSTSGIAELSDNKGHDAPEALGGPVQEHIYHDKSNSPGVPPSGFPIAAAGAPYEPVELPTKKPTLKRPSENQERILADASPEPRPYSNLEVAPVSGLEVVPDETRLAQLKEEQAKIREKRNRLMSLQALEDEEERLRYEIENIEGRRA